MEFDKVHLIYFSATGTTAKIVHAIGSGIKAKEAVVHNLIKHQETPAISDNTVAVFGVPVFSGRMPEIAKATIEKIKGNNSPAIIICVYGNRDFEDALIELKDVVEKNGFYVLSAGAFVAQHSIFPKVACGRPDTSDLAKAKKFGAMSIKVAHEFSGGGELEAKGNRPYKTVKPIPLHPKTSKACNSCKACAKQCPTQAINMQNPKIVDKKKCISCAHCIAICPTHAKKFGGLLYRLVSKQFAKKYSERKETYVVYRKI